ncbi:hypothetical protein GQ43DRAFT_152099 [Delitschia confertaspora ATCC 74209]|uniref:Uncharacterized protein n=1 Tax=Delitschia confertaspora ATCC 74209 TaxID=1513339 RepID=A0A9P4JSH1_9PLEO|nr:hypothetical protein GQ43DRAFT_152099 [Delitschia confertaspora ATCC 74209]
MRITCSTFHDLQATLRYAAEKNAYGYYAHNNIEDSLELSTVCETDLMFVSSLRLLQRWFQYFPPLRPSLFPFFILKYVMYLWLRFLSALLFEPLCFFRRWSLLW